MNFAGSKPTASKSARLDTADLTVVGGGGHVGIPLVLAFADAGYRVNVHDTNREVLETLRAGRLPFTPTPLGALYAVEDVVRLARELAQGRADRG